jgi:hypothetical protein
MPDCAVALDPRAFAATERCWICDSPTRRRVQREVYDLDGFTAQDPEVSRYTGCEFWLVRCRRCGFIQPEMLPTLPGFFGRLYDQHWSEDWLEREFASAAKDLIFGVVVSELGRRVGGARGGLLDVGAHVGKFIDRARAAGWRAEGVELNARTAAYAVRRTGLPVHRLSLEALVASGRRYRAVIFTDVLEHIPCPRAALTAAHELLEPGGWIAVKVPYGRSQLLKERVRARLRGGRPAVATNLVHVNHFSPRSLRLVLTATGFDSVDLSVGAPELLPYGGSPGALAANALRLTCYHLARALPWGTHSPLAFNLHAFARKPEQGS